MCKRELPFSFAGNGRMTVRAAFDALSAEVPIPVNLLGFTYQMLPGTNQAQLVPVDGHSVVQAQLIPLEPRRPRRAYHRGIRVAIASMESLTPDSTGDGPISVTDPSQYPVFWFRQDEDDRWVIEYEVDADTCPRCTPQKAIGTAA